MNNLNFIYKIENNYIKKEKIICRNWYGLTTVDINNQTYFYNINDIDKDTNIFTHIILAYNFYKNNIQKVI